MKAENKNYTKTVLVITVGFGIVYLLFNIQWALYSALILGVLGIISNKFCQLIDFLWMKLAKILSYIIPNILLSAVFYFLLFPIAILSRIFRNNDYLQLKNKNRSYWTNSNGELGKSAFEKMW